MAHPVEELGKLISYRGIDGKERTYNLVFGQELIQGVNCHFCGREAIIRHTITPSGEYSCHCCTTFYKGTTPEELQQGRVARINSLRHEVDGLAKQKDELVHLLEVAGAIFEDPEYIPRLRHPPRGEEPSKKTGGNFGLTNAVSMGIIGIINRWLNPFSGN
jgi:hypothetical protein